MITVFRFHPEQALVAAAEIGARSPCAKSKRGVVIWDPEDRNFMVRACNHPPAGQVCDGSEECRANCRRLTIHAELGAILAAAKGQRPLASYHHMLHVKVVDGKPVPSGPPSCEDCSKHILGSGIGTMWLLHEDGLKSYTAHEFHELSLQYKKLPIIRP